MVKNRYYQEHIRGGGPGRRVGEESWGPGSTDIQVLCKKFLVHNQIPEIRKRVSTMWKNAYFSIENPKVAMF